MTNFAWMVVENVVLILAFLALALLLDGWWRLLSLAPLSLCNVWSGREVARSENRKGDRT